MTFPGLDKLFEFASLHLRTCGARAIAMAVQGAGVSQRCVCGAAMGVHLSNDEVDAFIALGRSDRAFKAAMYRAARRVEH